MYQLAFNWLPNDISVLKKLPLLHCAGQPLVKLRGSHPIHYIQECYTDTRFANKTAINLLTMYALQLSAIECCLLPHGCFIQDITPWW